MSPPVVRGNSFYRFDDEPRRSAGCAGLGCVLGVLAGAALLALALAVVVLLNTWRTWL